MSFSGRLKKQFLTDFVVIIGILILLVIFVWISGKQPVGWEISGATEKLVGEERTVSENIFIYESGSLELEDSTILFSLDYDSNLGLHLEGDSSLVLHGSRIESPEFQYFIYAVGLDDKSPQIKITDSVITDHAGIYLYNRTKFEVEGSTIEEFQMHDRVHATLKNSKIYPVFFSDRKEVYSDLAAGDNISMEMESNSGWTMSLDDCEVWGYQIDILHGNNIEITDSRDIVLSVHLDGDSEEESILDVPTDQESSGEMSNLGFDLLWENTVFEMLNVYVENGGEYKVVNSQINEFVLSESGVLELSDLVLHCNLCSVDDTATLLLSGVDVIPESDTEPRLLITGSSNVTITDSNIENLQIIVMDGGHLTLINSEYDEDKIENRGTGTIDFD